MIKGLLYNIAFPTMFWRKYIQVHIRLFIIQNQIVVTIIDYFQYKCTYRIRKM